MNLRLSGHRVMGARLVHSIFGEGVNPRLRKIRDVLDAVGLTSDMILKHGNRRIIYGIPLASNFREVLLGRQKTADPILPTDDPMETTRQMADYWRRRWLAPRIENKMYIDQVARNTLTYPVQHGRRASPIVAGG